MITDRTSPYHRDHLCYLVRFAGSDEQLPAPRDCRSMADAARWAARVAHQGRVDGRSRGSRYIVRRAGVAVARVIVSGCIAELHDSVMAARGL